MVSIIYVNWNTCKWIDTSIKVIETNPPKVKYEIVIVDNGSEPEDNFKEWAEFHPQYRYVFNEYNMGFGYACNQAILVSEGKYICILNPDTEPEAGWLDCLVKYLEENPECGLAAPSMTNVCQPRQSRDYNKGDIVEVKGEVIPFACVVIPKKMFCYLGLLSLMWGEDIEFCKRLSTRNKSLVVIGKAFVKHAGGCSFSENKIGYNVRTITDYLAKFVYPRILGR